MSFDQSCSQPKLAETSTQQPEPLPEVSIIVPVYNGARIISRLLDSIQRLDYPADRYEVLVVDNNSSDDLGRVVETYPVKLLHERNVQSSYAARNLGVKQASGTILAFTDADCVVHPQWLRCLQAPFQEHTVGGTAGDIRGIEPTKSWVEEVLSQRHHLSCIDRQSTAGDTQPDLRSSFRQPTRRLPRLLNRLDLVTYRYDPRLPSLPIAFTANVAYRREAFGQAGLFDETFISGGDTEFAIRMQQKTSLKLVSAPEAIVYHRHRDSLRRLWRAYSRYEIGHLALVDKYLGLDDGLRRQLLTESLVYLAIGVPWGLAQIVLGAVRGLLSGAPHALHVQGLVVNLVTLMSRHICRLRSCSLYYQGRRGALWMP